MLCRDASHLRPALSLGREGAAHCSAHVLRSGLAPAAPPNTSLRNTPHPPTPASIRTLGAISRRPQTVISAYQGVHRTTGAGIPRSEVKEEDSVARPSPGDMSGGGCLRPSSRDKQAWAFLVHLRTKADRFNLRSRHANCCRRKMSCSLTPPSPTSAYAPASARRCSRERPLTCHRP
jgi:hypothetical protein